jgi:FkbM family methyltransferase
LETTWAALPDFYRFAATGGQVRQIGADLYELSLATQLRFQSTTDHLADVFSVLVERFVDEEYAALNVRDAVVMDVGSHIGDSAVYFLQRGAAFVHCYEPFPELIESAKRNLRLNGLEERVSFHQVGLADTNSDVRAKFDRRARATNSATATSDGGSADYQTVRIQRFSDALLEVRVAHPRARLICKVDCEGCEREIFGTSESGEMLVQCDEWAIEFHPEVPEPFVQSLRGLGFVTRRVSTPWGAEMLFATRASRS